MEKKTLIVVWNAANRGKTETLKKLSKLISDQYIDQIDHMDYQKSENNNDFEMYFTIKGKKIGIVSEGDPKTGLGGKLYALEKAGCELMVCTSRTKGETVLDIEKFSKEKKVNLIWSQTYKVDGAMKSDADILNETNLMKAKHLLKLIQKKELI